MADVQAVADRIVVLRLGRNNGDFLASEVSYEDIIAAITGATEHARPMPEPVYPAPRRIGPAT
jgi:D-xylose transport system ATP-binding protein